MTLSWGMPSNIGSGIAELERDAVAQGGGLVLHGDRCHWGQVERRPPVISSKYNCITMTFSQTTADTLLYVGTYSGLFTSALCSIFSKYNKFIAQYMAIKLKQKVTEMAKYLPLC